MTVCLDSFFSREGCVYGMPSSLGALLHITPTFLARPDGYCHSYQSSFYFVRAPLSLLYCQLYYIMQTYCGSPPPIHYTIYAAEVS